MAATKSPPAQQSPDAAGEPATPPEQAPPPAPPAAAPTPEPEPDAGGVFEYLGEAERVVMPEGAPPQTVEHGDIVALPFTPPEHDPAWRPSAKSPTRLPDPVEAAAREERERQELEASAGRQERSA